MTTRGRSIQRGFTLESDILLILRHDRPQSGPVPEGQHRYAQNMAKSKLLKNSNGNEEKKDWNPAASKISERDTVVRKESIRTTRIYLMISRTVFRRAGWIGSLPKRSVYHNLYGM